MIAIENIPLEDYPKGVLDLIEVMGVPSTLLFIEQFGGLNQLYVPKIMMRDHNIAKVVGYDAAAKLAARYGGDVIKNIPLCKDGLRKLQDIEILNRYLAGEQPKDMYRDYGMTERGIWKALKRIKSNINTKQKPLFPQ